MPRTINFNRDILVALILGASALVSNLILITISQEDYFIPLGNIFLFMSAGALGLPGGLVSFGVSDGIYSLIFGRYYEFIRVLILTTAIGYCTKRYARLPSFAVALALWLLLFGPFYIYLRSVSVLSNSITSENIFLTGLCEVILVMISGVLLINGKIWGTICTIPRHIPASTLLVHVITSISTLAMFGALSVASSSSDLRTVFHNDSQSPAGLMSMLLLGITIPAFLAWRLSVILSNNFQELFSAGLLNQGINKSFSGLSSEFWRRQGSDDSVQYKHPLDSPISAHENREDANSKIIPPNQGICALNRNGTITFVNRKFRKFCEIQSNDVLGRNIENISMNPTLCKQILLLLEDTFNKGARTIEVKINQLPEKLKFFEISSHYAETFQDASIINGPDSLILIVKDITEKRTVESHLLQTQKLESLGTLVEGIAHTFNNSLTAIAGQASFAKRCQEREHIEKSLNEILRTAFSAGSVVRQLLDFASSRTSLMKPENLREVLDERFDLLKRLVGDSCDIEFSKSSQEVSILCDTNLIMQALTNLVLNSKESYPQSSGRIIISLEKEEVDGAVTETHPGTRPGNFARLRVRDFGHGMSRDVLAKAFDPLFTTKASTGHTGLGLSIVFAIVRAHDGFLTAESHTDKGTTLSLYFPIHEGTRAESKSSSSISLSSSKIDLSWNSPELRGNQESILVVEDENSVRELVTNMLTNLGYNVVSCCNGEEALNESSKKDFDLLLVDMIIPKIKGLELINRLKESGSKAKALIMTGYGASLQLNDSNTKIIHKPFDIDTLAKAVKSILNELSKEGAPSKPLSLN